MNSLERSVCDVRDVAGRVVGVAQVLQHRWIDEDGREAVQSGRSRRPQMSQAEGVFIVGVGCRRAVAIGDQFALALGVVVDVRDRMLVCRARGQQSPGSASRFSHTSTRSSRLASL